jgi:ribonuclease BN (tRNA processing enzyme)
MQSERREPLTLLGPAGLENIMDGLKSAFGRKVFEPNFPVAVQVLKPGDRIELGRESIFAVAKTPHTPESLAARIENRGRALGYTGDTGYCEDLVGFFSGADVLISECSFREPRQDARHLSIAETARLATHASVAKLIVTHFYFDVDEAELKAELEHGYDGGVVIGRDGLSVEV